LDTWIRKKLFSNAGNAVHESSLGHERSGSARVLNVLGGLAHRSSAASSVRGMRLLAVSRNVLSSAKGQSCLAALFYAVFAIYLTWPLLPEINSRIFGVEPGDPMGSIAIFGEMVDERVNPFAPGRLEDFNAPLGYPIDWSVNIAAFPSTALLYIFAWVFGPVAGWGLFGLIGFAGSALSMFLFVRKYTSEPWVALVVGWAFGFYPFVVLTAHSVHFVHGWVFVLLGWRMLELAERPTPRNGLLAGAAAVLALAWTPYFILLAGVCYGTFVAVDLLGALVRGRFKTQGKAHAFSGAVVLPYLAAIAGLWILARPVNAPQEVGSGAVSMFAARPVEYLLPPVEHPIFGRWTGSFIARSVEPLGAVYPLYLGLSLLALALGASIVGFRRDSRVVLTFLAVASVGLAFSMPSQVSVFGQLIPLPSSLVSELIGTWRIYARFVIIVMLALCVLAAIGAMLLLQGRRRMVRTALLLALSIAVPLDLWSTPPVRTTKIRVPPIYHVLKAQPPGIVAEYPIRSADQSGNYAHLFYQHVHGKPVINGFPRRSQAEARALQLSRLDELSTPNVLAALGVKYVLLRHKVEPGAMPPGKPSKDFRPVADSPSIALYRVVARPTRSTTFPVSGFWLPEGQPPFIFRWMVETDAEVEIHAPCMVCVGTLEFRTVSFARPRTLTILDENRNVVARERVDPLQAKWIRVPLKFCRRTIVKFRVNPSPDRISEMIGGPDMRTVAISVVQPVRFRQRRTTEPFEGG
jgi:hypothetical protein